VGQRYDLILDNVGNHSLSACRRVLNPKCICVVAGAPKEAAGFFLVRVITAPAFSRLVNQKFIMFIAKLNKEDLIIMHDLMKSRKVTPVIDLTTKPKTVLRPALFRLRSAAGRVTRLGKDCLL
jgi:NADPH:quinone reductase-like Zn-dependent oxidoreductase